MTLNEMLDRLLEREGGYIDDPADAGGETKYGITRATLEDWRKEPLPEHAILNLTRAEAKDIYVAKYFIPGRVSSLPVALKEVMFDTCVNFGVKKAVRLLQAALNEQGACLVIDGEIGNKTLQTAASCDPDRARIAMVKHRVLYRDQQAIADRTQLDFLRGWHTRDLSFL